MDIDISRAPALRLRPEITIAINIDGLDLKNLLRIAYQYSGEAGRAAKRIRRMAEDEEDAEHRAKLLMIADGVLEMARNGIRDGATVEHFADDDDDDQEVDDAPAQYADLRF